MSHLKLLSKKAVIPTLCALALSLGLAATVRASVDMTQPVVSTVSPLTATAGQAVNLSITASDDDAGVRNCYLIIGVTSLSSDMTRVSGDDRSATYRQEYTFPFEGSYTVAARCVDRAENVGMGSNVTVVVSAAADVVAPIVGSVTPASAVAGAATTLSANFSDSIGVTDCQFNPGSGASLTATRSGTPQAGQVSYTYTFPSPGTYYTFFTCSDAAGNAGSALRTVTVAGSGPDVAPPVLGPVTNSTLTMGAPVDFGVQYTDNVGVSSCFLVVDGSSVGLATLSGPPTAGNAVRSYTFSTAGSHTVSMTCKDAAMNSGDSATRTITISSDAPAGDVLAPTFPGAISPLTATLNVPVTLSAAYSDNVGATECYLYVDGALAGGASSGGMTGTTSRSHTFASTGSHTARFQCRDAAGNVGVSTTYTVNVTAATPSGGVTGDRFAPIVGSVSNASVAANVSVRYSVTASDSDSGLARCELFVNGSSQGLMDINGSVAARSYTFTAPGTYSVYVSCWDRAGNGASGPVTSVLVTSSTTPTSLPPMGTLVKAMCPAYQVAADHPCRAVYYYGQDGRRHAFPNERVYFTWYRDFDGVREVTDGVLASMSLGRNVNYRPGLRMVKFTTLNRVYAVGRGGVLRWVTTEDIARQLYGSNWSSQIDDIADVFYTNYTFGTDITTTGQFNSSSEAALAMTIDQNW